MNTVTVEFTQEELNALGALLDAAVRASGIQAARSAMPLIAKLEAAASATAVATTEEQPS